MQKHHTKNTRISRSTNRRREAIRYVPIPLVASDVIWERFFDYEQRLAELEEQLRVETTISTIDIDSL